MKFTNVNVRKQTTSASTAPQGKPYPNGSYGMPKAGRGLDALTNIYRQE